MRNYFRQYAVRLYDLPFDPDSFYVIFGATEDELLRYSAILRQQVAPTQLLAYPPSVIWFELNQKNFANILNQASGTFWMQSRLNDRFPPLSTHELLYDMTRVESEGSPRPTWSHGH